MGCMDRAWREVDEERSVGSQRLLITNPFDRLICHVCHEVILRIVRYLHLHHSVIDQGRPLISFATHKSVELVESFTCGPVVGWPGRANFPGRRLMPFTKRRRAVAIESQNLGKWRNVVRTDSCVAWKRSRYIDDR